MSAITIAGDTSGSITLNAPAVAGTTTLNLPTVSGGTLVTSDSSGNVTLGSTTAIAPLGVYKATNPYFALGNSLYNTYFNQTNSDFHLYTNGTYPVRIGTNNTERLRIDGSGNFSAVIPSGSTSYPAFWCRAWINFNGTGTVSIRGSGNVTSLTDNGVGVYTINFTTAMPDTIYSVVSAGQYIGAGAISHSPTIGIVGANFNANALSTGSAQVNSSNDAASATDPSTACIAIFR